MLRELYTRDGAGLLIYADDSYDVTREATIEDVGGIVQLIQPLEKSGVLVPRSREQLELEIGNFNVMVRDGLVIACCALFPFIESQTGELACVAVHPAYRGGGRAALLLARAEQSAQTHGTEKTVQPDHAHAALVHRARLRAGPDSTTCPADASRCITTSAIRWCWSRTCDASSEEGRPARHAEFGVASRHRAGQHRTGTCSAHPEARVKNQDWADRSLARVWHPCTQMKDHEQLPLVPIAVGRRRLA